MEQIQRTHDLDQFKSLVGNRPISKAHINKLIRSISKDNQLNLHPIIINLNNEVIDGQHRLECAKRLGLEIFFIKADEITDEHLVTCNVNQKSFEVDNFIEYFAIKHRNPDYISLREMMKTSGLKPKAILTLLTGSVTQNVLEFVKTGKFRLPSVSDNKDIVALYDQFILYCKDKRISPSSMFSSHNFTRAFRWLVKTNGFDSSILFKKLDLKWFELKPQRTSEEWYLLLLDI